MSKYRSTEDIVLFWRRLKEPAHLIVRCRGEHGALQRVFGQIVGVDHHQVSTVEAGGEHKRDGADPLHDGVSLRCNLHRSNQDTGHYIYSGSSAAASTRLWTMIQWHDTYGEGSILYLTKPVIVWDWDVVGAVALHSAPAVNDWRQIREVSVQVDVLSVVSADVPGVVSAALWDLHVCVLGWG